MTLTVFRYIVNYKNNIVIHDKFYTAMHIMVFLKAFFKVFTRYFLFVVTMSSPCSLDAGYTLKFGDGALMIMSDFYLECYHVIMYGAQWPVRWSAMETLQGGLCSLPSNLV